MYYKYTLNKDGNISMEILNEYVGVLNEVIDNVFVTKIQRQDEEIKVLFKLFGKESKNV